MYAPVHFQSNVLQLLLFCYFFVKIGGQFRLTVI